MAKYFGLAGGWLTFWITVATCGAMSLFGYDQGVFGGIVITKDFLRTMNNPNANLIGTITSLYDVGCFFGAISGLSIGESLGRKKSIILGTVVMMIGAVIQFTSFGVPQMIVGRLICGLGNGLNTATAPVWQAETSPPRLRGKLVVIEMIMNIAGFSLANWMTYGVSHVSGSVSWRFPLAFQLVFGILLLSTVPWLPESPRWLIAHGRNEEAIDIIARIEGKGVPTDDSRVLHLYDDVQQTVEYERKNAPKWGEILRGKGRGNTKIIRRMVLGAGTQAMQQFSGINVTSYYLPTVLTKSVGLTEDLARLLAACNSVSYFVFSLIGIPIVERHGRRILMMGGAAGQSACYLAITILLRFADIGDSKKLGAASVAFFFLYYVFFGIGWQGVPWLYPAEINTLAMRTKGAAIGTATNWAINYMVVQITPIGIQNISWRFYIIWTVFNASFVPIVYFFYPETSDRTLEDIDRMMLEHKGAFVHHHPHMISAKRPEEFFALEQEGIRRRSTMGSDYTNGAAGAIGAAGCEDDVCERLAGKDNELGK